MTARDVRDMTPRYRAENLLALIAGRDFEQAISRIEQAFKMERESGAKQEREACAIIADEMKAELSQRPEKLQYGRSQIEVAEYIAKEIRARSEG